MPSRDVVVGSRVGLHQRTAARVVRAAADLPVTVRISKAGPPVDAGSILGVLGLGARCGDTVTLEAEGDGAEEALDTMADLIARDLDAETADA